uniref:ATP synthase subunit a n=1 Tax=Ardeacarus ardeae TaxID=1932962 RepID=A0A343BSH8_9ACAR|nr:ATP synthase F0 subunit 6 [Ardeacarus ardeae]
MMTNMFSIFDPSLFLFNGSWLLFVFTFFLMPCLYWCFGIFFMVWNKVYGFFLNEVSYSIFSPKKGVLKFFTCIFLMIFSFNFFSLYPFIFSLTSHLLVTMPLAYSFWLAIIFFGLFKSFYDFLVHLIPSGTPFGLISFMVFIELLSNFIRPVSLTFRLVANMMAGHLLMSLIVSFFINLYFEMGIIVLSLGFLLQGFLIIMELGVSFIQAYVFFTLLLLYMSENETSSH